ITNLLVLIAALSAANANLYAGSRMVHSLAADGLAPRFAAHTTARKVPVVGIALSSVGLLGAALLAFSGVGGVFNYMMSLVVFAVILVWALILCAYIAFRRRRVTGATFRMPGGIGGAVVGLIGLAAVFGTIAVRPSREIAALVGGPAARAATGRYVAVARRRVDPGDTAGAGPRASGGRSSAWSAGRPGSARSRCGPACSSQRSWECRRCSSRRCCTSPSPADGSTRATSRRPSRRRRPCAEPLAVARRTCPSLLCAVSAWADGSAGVT